MSGTEAVVELYDPLAHGMLSSQRQHLRQKLVRSAPGLATIPVAIVTSDYYPDEPQANELQALGAQLHYTPLWLNELVTLARDLVA